MEYNTQGYIKALHAVKANTIGDTVRLLRFYKTATPYEMKIYMSEIREQRAQLDL